MTVPAAIANIYGFEAEPIRPLDGGLINETYVVGGRGRERAVLQKLHPVFDPIVNADIDRVTARLAEAGLDTPRIVPTRDGALYHDRWRALTFVPGQSFDAVQSIAQAEAAAGLVGRFHAALHGWDYRFAFQRSGVHDTAAHVARLAELLDSATAEPAPGVLKLADDILVQAARLPPLPRCPPRICHGDLKISNVRFDPRDAEKPVCLLDLDTIGRQTIAYEMGDAMRSWCNRAAEDAPIAFDTDVFAASLRGYRSTIGDLISEAEIETTVLGLMTVCTELASRFAADIFDDSYFGWDASRYPNRRAHNTARANAMHALSAVVSERRNELVNLIHLSS